MNNKIGFSKFLTHDRVISVLFHSIKSFSLRVRSITFEILSAVCCHEEGHKKVADCLTELSKAEFIPYSSIIECLDTNKMMKLFESIDAESDIGFMDRVVELHVSCLTFLNSLLFNGNVQDASYRLRVAADLYHAGMDSAIKVCKL